MFRFVLWSVQKGLFPRCIFFQKVSRERKQEERQNYEEGDEGFRGGQNEELEKPKKRNLTMLVDK